MGKTLRNVPVPIAGVALGLVALGTLLSPLSAALQVALALVALLLVALVVARACLHPAQMRQDMANPVAAAVLATLFMALMQLAALLAVRVPGLFALGQGLWWVAVGCHLALMAWFTMRHMRPFDLRKVFPSSFICYVGIIVAAVTAPAFGLQPVGQVLFWLGFALYPGLLAMVTLRCLRHPLEQGVRPLLCIYSAPASLSLVGYLAVTPVPDMAFAAMLLGVGQAFLVFALVQVPGLIRAGFFPSYAAMTFPFVISALGLCRFMAQVSSLGFAVPQALGWVAAAEVALATFMVLFVLARYTAFLLRPALRRADGKVRGWKRKPEPVAAADGGASLE